MAIREYRGLGFDPAPGDPTQLLAAAEQVDGAAGTLSAGASGLDQMSRTHWSGPAADAFVARLGDLPRDLTTAHRAHGDTADALRRYGTALAGFQRRARDLDDRAEQIRSRRAAAYDEVNRLADARAPVGSSALATLRADYRAARSRAEGFNDELEVVLGQARLLSGEHRDAAEEARHRIRSAAGTAPYEKPAWYKRAWDATKNWVADNADTLRTISSGLKIASGVLGLLALIPVVGGVFGAAALVVGGAALLLDVGLKLATGEGSWTSIGIDAAMTFVPGGKLANLAGKGVKAARAGTAVRGTRAAAESGSRPALAFGAVARDSGRAIGRAPVRAIGRAPARSTARYGVPTHFTDVEHLSDFYGPLLRSDGSAVARAHLKELTKAPIEHHRVVRDAMAATPRGGIYVGDARISELGLPGVEHWDIPGGRPGLSVDEAFSGVYSPRDKALLIGNLPTASSNLALHEFGHAVSHVGGELHQAPVFVTRLDQAWAIARADPASRIPDYFTQPEIRYVEGWAEMYAENYRGGGTFFGSKSAFAPVARYFRDLFP